MIDIRKAVPEDALGIAIVNSYTWKTAYTGLVPDALIDQRIAELIPRAGKILEGIERGGHYLVAVDGDTVVGFCMFGAFGEPEYPGAGEVYALYILTGFQGTGIGKRLFMEACETMKAEGYASVIVNCLDGNAAFGFYRRMGCEPIDRWEDESTGFPMAGNVLRLELH